MLLQCLPALLPQVLGCAGMSACEPVINFAVMLVLCCIPCIPCSRSIKRTPGHSKQLSQTSQSQAVPAGNAPAPIGTCHACQHHCSGLRAGLGWQEMSKTSEQDLMMLLPYVQSAQTNARPAWPPQQEAQLPGII